MAKITYIEFLNKKKHVIEVPNGMTIMDGAVQNAIPGVDAECGGACACATCHVYIDENFFNKISKIESAEQDMLDMAYEPNKLSRLSCQIVVNDDLDGMVVNLPLKQA